MSQSNKKQPTIKQQLAELDRILEWFEGDKFEIEQALEQYQLAEKLVKQLEESLKEQKNQIIKL